jgi:hypothetical protein
MPPHLAYISTRLLPTSTSEPQPLWMICPWAQLLSSSAHTLAQTFQQPHKSNMVWLHTFMVNLSK